MQQTRNVKAKKKQSHGSYVVLLGILVCVILGAIFLARPKEQVYIPSFSVNDPPAEVQENFNSDDAGLLDEPSPEPAPEPGTLLESGININDNYYKKLDYSGMPTDLTASSFILGKEHPATIGKTGQDYPGSLTILFGDDTVVKTALLYYADDRYEICMGTIGDLKVTPGYTFDVILEDPEAAELWAKEIIISSFVF